MMSYGYNNLCLGAAVKEERRRRSVLDGCDRPNTMKQEVWKEKPPAASQAVLGWRPVIGPKSHPANFTFTFNLLKTIFNSGTLNPDEPEFRVTLCVFLRWMVCFERESGV